MHFKLAVGLEANKMGKYSKSHVRTNTASPRKMLVDSSFALFIKRQGEIWFC